MEAAAARDDVARIAGSLKADAKFEQVARAIDEGRMQDAVALLRRVEEGSSGGQKEEAIKHPGVEGGNQAAGDADQEPKIKDTALNKDAIRRVMNDLAHASERIEVQTWANEVKRRMDDDPAINQRSGLGENRFDDRSTKANPTGLADPGDADTSDGTQFSQATTGQTEEKAPRPGAHNGNASKDFPARPVEGAASKRLDGHLKLETLLQNYDGNNAEIGAEDRGWFYSASRQQQSTLRSESIRREAVYERERPMNHEAVPIRQKAMVKNYFLDLHESEKK